jgi:ABC-type tungstate transport system substrate-binding protein
MPNHFQETILTPRTITYVVKAMIMGGNMKQETKNINIDIDL